ncbi:hypothetical protein DV736_g4352, partial [Chaetothyriales sp. CBS 134916]
MAVSKEDKAVSAEPLSRYSQQQRSGSLGALRDVLDMPKGDSDPDSLPDDEGSDGNRESKRTKRARACIACRNMKIRCLPVEGKDACLACSKVNRECVMPGPARKRQKTVHKVAELEKKINALTEALVAKNAATNSTPPTESSVNDRTTESQSDMTRSDNDPRSPGKRSVRSLRLEESRVAGLLSSSSKTDLDISWHGLATRDAVDSPYVDPIERGVLDVDTAVAIFDHYVTKMLPLFPVLSFPSYIKAEDVREARPTLFLAILSVGSSAIRPDLQPDLVVECSKLLSERVLFLGEKSLELVQALLTYTTYYVRSKYAKDLAFNQYIHAAVVMCLDLGIGKRSPKYLRNTDGVEEATIRRTWLACYYFASSVSTILRHPSLVRWSAYIEECLQYFSTSPHTLESDVWLCALARAQHIAEEVSIVFTMDDPSAVVSFGDTKTGYHLKALEKKLAEWKASAPAYMDKRLVEHIAASQNLYIHEISIQNAYNIGESQASAGAPSAAIDPASLITAVHIDALTTCVDSCHRVLNSYLALDVETARKLPNLFIVWNTFAAVGLIKLEGVVHGIQSPFRTIFTPDLHVDRYLSSITQKLIEVSGNGSCPPAEAFSFVMKKLISWHQHRREVGLWVPGDDGSTHEAKDPDKDDNSGDGNADPNAHVISDLNTAFNAANYNLNWDELNFSQDELNVFDSYMNDRGWIGYLI